MFSKLKLVIVTMLLVLFTYPIAIAFGINSSQQSEKTAYRNGQLISLGGPIAYYRSVGKEYIKTVANKFGLDVNLVAVMNQMESESQLVTGQKILLPDDRVIVHEVKRKETVYRIARIYGASLQRIIDENDLKDVYKLQIGTKLLVPVPLKSIYNRGGNRGFHLTNNIFEWPATGIFSSPFGWRWGRMHNGIDLASKKGTPIKAARSGLVTFAGRRGSYGKAVFISHGNNVSTRYGHASKILVEKGQYVYQGETIALVGNTGRSTGPHLHFEIRIDDKAINPMNYLPKR